MNKVTSRPEIGLRQTGGASKSARVQGKNGRDRFGRDRPE